LDRSAASASVVCLLIPFSSLAQLEHQLTGIKASILRVKLIALIPNESIDFVDNIPV
jgi:hypothetical protein